MVLKKWLSLVIILALTMGISPMVKAADALDIKAESAILIDADLQNSYEKNIDKRMPPASD